MIDRQTALRLLKRGLFDKHAPLLAQLVVTRFCNLDCNYCNEFDKVSQPVNTEQLLTRIDHLARLDSAVVTCTGGEPLTHPDVALAIKRIRHHGMGATLNTNGFLLTRQWIDALNDAGLQGMQISVDGVNPTEGSKKSLKSLSGKLELLRDYARFGVNINSVIGADHEKPEELLEVATLSKDYGFSHSVSLIHDSSGRSKPFGTRHREVYAKAQAISGSLAHRLNNWLFQGNLIEGRPNQWECRAGARYLYICESGLVHWCSQNRGYPGIPLQAYTRADIAREFNTEKPCAPTCTLSCVHQASAFDRWRLRPQRPRPQTIGDEAVARS